MIGGLNETWPNFPWQNVGWPEASQVLVGIASSQPKDCIPMHTTRGAYHHSTKSPQSQFHWENGSYQQSVGDFPQQKRLELKDSSWKMLKTIRIAAIPTASIGIPNLRRALDASSLKVIGRTWSWAAASPFLFRMSRFEQFSKNPGGWWLVGGSY